MLKPQTKITITQQGDGRTLQIEFDFVTHWEFSNNWEDLSAQGKVVFPKNIYVTNPQTNTRYPLFGTKKNVGGFTQDAIFKRGDKIKIESRYSHWDENLNEKQTQLVTIIDGYITQVGSGMPIELSFEDSMYLLKQTPMTNKAFKSSDTFESILSEALKVTNNKFGTKLTVNSSSETRVTYEHALLTAENETIATFLAKLKKDTHIFSYFRGNELRLGRLVYVEGEAVTKEFEFQVNIISSDLSYKRKEDVILSAVASNHITEKVGTTKQGKEKTRSKRLEVLVWIDREGRVQHKSVKEGDKADPNTDGERRTFTYPEAKTEQQLIELATENLKKYYYSGFKGKFTTFGTPYVQFGDNAKIINKILPEQDGIYKIKGVEYEGGVDGWRQTIELDYKIDV